jgi:hypothetical protein
LNKKVSVVNSVFISAHTSFLVLAGLVVRNFLLRDFALTQLKNYNILRIDTIFFVFFRFNAACHRRSVAALISCKRLAESDALPRRQSRVWIDFISDVIIRLM